MDQNCAQGHLYNNPQCVDITINKFNLADPLLDLYFLGLIFESIRLSENTLVTFTHDIFNFELNIVELGCDNFHVYEFLCWQFSVSHNCYKLRVIKTVPENS
jgi:hypothetical protein